MLLYCLADNVSSLNTRKFDERFEVSSNVVQAPYPPARPGNRDILAVSEPRTKRGTPVCITGMHRSGTSSLAQLLYRCGVYLGNERELFAAGPANPDGYWENGRLVSISNRIFEAYRGGWDLPPDLEEGWQNSERLAPLRSEAAGLLHGLESSGHWGWKDPRGSLTMPFWLDLLPEAKVVISLRNPLEVALSLRKRGNSSLAFGLNLWTVYSRRLLDALSPDQYIVTHYGAYFYRPQDEIRRVLGFLGLPASDQLVAHARSTSLKGLRHHSVAPGELLETPVAPPEMHDLYVRMCREADFDPDKPAPVSDGTLSEALAAERSPSA